jgi:sRNA-binding carbon storage regulator CsrA
MNNNDNRADKGNLLISRHAGQSVIIDLAPGVTCSVSVVSTDDKKTILAFSAPKDIPINRREKVRSQ